MTLAAALRRSRAPFSWHIFEQAESLGEVGAGIQLAPNATRLLERLGIGPALERAAVRPDSIETRRWSDGTVLASTPLGDSCAQRYAAPYYVLHRADLHKALAGLVPSCDIRLDTAVTQVVDGKNGAELLLSDGSTFTADLVVGADGIRSTVRCAIHDDVPRFSGLVLNRGLIPAELLPHVTRERKVTLWLGPGRHVVCYPVSRATQLNLVAITPVAAWDNSSWTQPARAQDLAADFAGWAPEVRSIFACLDDATQWALYDRDPVTRWSGLRLTLIGDAAHPVFPFGAQGANQAIEDAFALAVAVAKHPRDISVAMRAYEAIRISRTASVFENSRGNAVTFHLPDGKEQKRRDAVLGAAHVWRDRDWLFGYDAEQAAMEWTGYQTGEGA